MGQLLMCKETPKKEISLIKVITEPEERSYAYMGQNLMYGNSIDKEAGRRKRRLSMIFLIFAANLYY